MQYVSYTCGVTRCLARRCCTRTILRLSVSSETNRYFSAQSHSSLTKQYKNHVTTGTTCNFNTARRIHITRLSQQGVTTDAGNSVSFKLSDIGEGISEVTIKEWFVKVGDHVNQFDPICEVQSDKASVTITSRYDGIISKLHHEVEGIAKVGQPLVDIQLEKSDDGTEGSSSVDTTPESVVSSNNSQEPPESVLQTTSSEPSDIVTNKVLATPAVRRMAGEMKIPLHEVPATGKGGRVLKDDIFAFLNKKEQEEMGGSLSPQPSGRQAPISSSTGSFTSAVPSTVLSLKQSLEAKTVPISGYTRAMVKIMTSSLEIPHFGYKDEIDLSKIVSVRKEMADEAKLYGVKLSYMPFFVKAASLALHHYPILNASLSPCKEKIIYSAEHNIGLAVDTPVGLIVPNIKNCQDKSILEIGAELNRLQTAALAGKVATSDLAGGTFSISNIGSIGGTYTFPVIAPPNVCIGALGRIRKVPRYEGDNIIPAHVLEVSWSADHRIIDGATMARFSNLWKRYLEKPHLLLMHLK